MIDAGIGYGKMRPWKSAFVTLLFLILTTFVGGTKNVCMLSDAETQYNPEGKLNEYMPSESVDVVNFWLEFQKFFTVIKTFSASKNLFVLSRR